MTVLIDATALESGHRWRGIGRYVRALTVGMLRARPSTTRFLTVAGVPDGLPPVGVVKLKSVMPQRWDETWPLYIRAIRRTVHASGCSLYHFTSPEASLRANGLATVATVYDLIPLESRTWTADPRGLWRKLLYRRYLDHVRRSRHVIAISQSTATSLMQHLSIPAEHISVIPLGIEFATFAANPAELQSTVHSDFDLPERYWFSLTSPNPNKGWPDLLAAVAATRRRGVAMPLVVAGHWLPKQRQSLLSRAEALGVRDLVRFIGYVSDDQLPALYAGAFAFLFASRREGFGFPLLEAMASGTPAVTSDDPALIELAGDAALIFTRGDHEALAERMATLASDEALRQELKERGRRRSLGFSWMATIERTLEVYDRLSRD